VPRLSARAGKITEIFVPVDGGKPPIAAVKKGLELHFL